MISLDVSKNIALERLYCENNQLTTIDVSKNTKLLDLYCSNNLLTTLDLSKNTALEWLMCYQNQIKGSGMDALVESLPAVSDGTLYVIMNEDEGNVMTTVQVAAAKEKGWMPYYYSNSWWDPYPGSDPSDIEELKKAKVEGSKYYDLQGHRIPNPQKGIFIQKGKKVVLK